MNNKTRIPQVPARLLAKPADDRHPAVSSLVIDQHFPTQVMIEMDLVPGRVQQLNALLDGLHTHCTRVPGQESRRAIGGVVWEQDRARTGPWLVHKAVPECQSCPRVISRPRMSLRNFVLSLAEGA